MIGLLAQMVAVVGARIASLAIWLVGLVLVYRLFGTGEGGLAEAGAFAFSLALIKALVSFVGDAIDLHTMRAMPLLLREDRTRGHAVWRTAMALRLGLATVLAALLALAAPWVAALFLDDPDRAALLRVAAFAVFAELAYRGVLGYLQARERFVALVALEASLQVARLALIAALLLGWEASALAALSGYAAASALVAASGLALPFVMPREAFAGDWLRRAIVADTLGYVRWIVPAMLLAALNERADIFLLAALRGPVETGLYGAILPLALAPDMVGAFLASVVQPKVAAMRAEGRYRAHALPLTALFVPLAALAALAFAWFREEVVLLTVGSAYLDAADAFAILFAGTMAWLALTPLSLAFVVLRRPRTTLVVSVAQSCFVLAVGLPLVGALGVVGAAATIASMRVVFGAALWVLAWRDSAHEAVRAGRRRAADPLG